jgi:hypothetical protein
MNDSTRAFVRAKGTFIWHEVKKAAGVEVQTECGLRYRAADVQGTARIYDKRTTWPPRFAKWCFTCQEAHRVVRRAK